MCTSVKALGLLAAIITAANPVVLFNATGTTEDPMMATLDPEVAEMEEGFNRLNEDLGRFATKQFFPIVSEILYDTRLSSECAGGLLKLGTALRDSEIWVIQIDRIASADPGGVIFTAESADSDLTRHWWSLLERSLDHRAP
ncbi:hypothetical protein HPB47_023683 [Ixodes persulcatus]|uniref:Uncharacterized protein n=1 Tax=Ixodes persulcatus TaxID=34615 RepID=A0AC60Q680_IXOPE|nr:hypothetical protein HPB47_023683 [Ixodes persulcatus]